MSSELLPTTLELSDGTLHILEAFWIAHRESVGFEGAINTTGHSFEAV